MGMFHGVGVDRVNLLGGIHTPHKIESVSPDIVIFKNIAWKCHDTLF